MQDATKVVMIDNWGNDVDMCVMLFFFLFFCFFFQAEDGIRDRDVTGVQTCALPIWIWSWRGW